MRLEADGLLSPTMEKKWQSKETLGLSFFALLKRKTHRRP